MASVFRQHSKTLCVTGSVSPGCKCQLPELFLTCTSLYSENISHFSYGFSRLEGICDRAGRLTKRLAPVGQDGLVAGDGEGVRIPGVPAASRSNVKALI